MPRLLSALSPTTFFTGVLKFLALTVITAAAMISFSGQSHANLVLSKMTQKGCGYCHSSPPRPALNPTGSAFQRCGYKFGCDQPMRPATQPQRPTAPQVNACKTQCNQDYWLKCLKSKDAGYCQNVRSVCHMLCEQRGR
jgi:hypothetical protein